MRKIISGILAISITIILFAQGFYYSMQSLKNGIDSETAEVDASAVVVTYEASPAAADSITETETVTQRDIGCTNYWSTLYMDSRGAVAYGWEIEECIRELMLEAGGESEEDIREHAAVYCKQLLYTQTVGGYDDWGLTLHEVVYSHGYVETWPNIWTEAAEPTETVREIFWDVWNNGYTSDFRVQVFRKDWYHSLIWSIPAYSIGRTYYSVNIWQDFSAWGY